MRNMRIYTVLVGLTLLLAACTSYEDAFNRNLDSTGLYITNSSSNTVSQFAADPKSGILNDLGTVAAGTTPVYVAVNATGTFAYVVNSGSNDVYVYSINKKTRKLAFASSVATGTLPRMIGLHSGGKFAYVVNETDNDISRYSIDATTGALTSLGADEATAANPSRALAISDNLLYVPDAGTNTVKLFNMDATTGALAPNMTPSATLDAGEIPISIFISGGSAPFIYLPCANNTLVYFARSPWPPALTTNQISVGATPVAVVLNPNRTVGVVSNSGDASLSIFSVTNGVPTAAGTISTCTTPGQMLINSSGFGYLVCNGDNTVRAYSVSGASLSLINSYPVGTAPTSVAAY
jgi:6-phosphogluconolactonase (cycloisomerase 2 family)